MVDFLASWRSVFPNALQMPTFSSTPAETTAFAKKLRANPPAVGGVVGVNTAWNAIGTTGKVAVGLGGGYLLGSIFGGGKKQEQQQTFAPQNPVQKNYSYQYSPQTTTATNITGDWSTNFIYSSPGANIKKGNIAGQAGPVSPTLAPVLTASPSQSASQQGSQGQGTDWATLAAIAGVALVAYGYTSRKGAK